MCDSEILFSISNLGNKSGVLLHGLFFLFSLFSLIKNEKKSDKIMPVVKWGEG